jgi:hypothetical protein
MSSIDESRYAVAPPSLSTIKTDFALTFGPLIDGAFGCDDEFRVYAACVDTVERIDEYLRAVHHARKRETPSVDVARDASLIQELITLLYTATCVDIERCATRVNDDVFLCSKISFPAAPVATSTASILAHDFIVAKIADAAQRRKKNGGLPCFVNRMWYIFDTARQCLGNASAGVCDAVLNRLHDNWRAALTMCANSPIPGDQTVEAIKQSSKWWFDDCMFNWNRITPRRVAGASAPPLLLPMFDLESVCAHVQKCVKSTGLTPIDRFMAAFVALVCHISPRLAIDSSVNGSRAPEIRARVIVLNQLDFLFAVAVNMDANEIGVLHDAIDRRLTTP